MQTITIKIRLRDKHAAELNRQARAVNFVWNYLNETQKKAAQSGRKWLSAFDLIRLTSGASKELDINGHTIQRVCRQYEASRTMHNKPWLRWRGRRSLGWVPFNTDSVTISNEGVITFRGLKYETMHWREHLKPGVAIGAGSFNQDARGHWFFNAPIQVETASDASLSYVGIDLGLNALAALSSGEMIETPRLYRASEGKLAAGQGARKTARVRKIHAKIANRRKDFLHKASAKIAREHGLIIVGDVSPKKIAQTRFAKSSLDAGWSSFKQFLSYKAIRHGGRMLEISERFSSQTCSECGSLPPSRPKGIAGLSKRTFECDDCGSVLDRDVNAARNICRVGRDTLIGGAHV